MQDISWIIDYIYFICLKLILKPSAVLKCFKTTSPEQRLFGVRNKNLQNQVYLRTDRKVAQVMCFQSLTEDTKRGETVEGKI